MLNHHYTQCGGINYFFFMSGNFKGIKSNLTNPFYQPDKPFQPLRQRLGERLARS